MVQFQMQNKHGQVPIHRTASLPEGQPLGQLLVAIADEAWWHDKNGNLDVNESGKNVLGPKRVSPSGASLKP